VPSSGPQKAGEIISPLLTACASLSRDREGRCWWTAFLHEAEPAGRRPDRLFFRLGRRRRRPKSPAEPGSLSKLLIWSSCPTGGREGEKRREAGAGSKDGGSREGRIRRESRPGSRFLRRQRNIRGEVEFSQCGRTELEVDRGAIPDPANSPHMKSLIATSNTGAAMSAMVRVRRILLLLGSRPGRSRRYNGGTFRDRSDRPRRVSVILVIIFNWDRSWELRSHPRWPRRLAWRRAPVRGAGGGGRGGARSGAGDRRRFGHNTT
jgi:hypothetical protein